MEVRRVDLANWVIRTSPKFATGILTRSEIQKSHHPSPPLFFNIVCRFEGLGASTFQVIGARIEWYFMMILKSKCNSGTLEPKASCHLSYMWGKTRRKTSPRKLVPNGDRTRARCVTGAHSTACPTAVDVSICSNMLHLPHIGLVFPICWSVTNLLT